MTDNELPHKWSEFSGRQAELKAWADWLRKEFPVSRQVNVYLRKDIRNSKGDACDGYGYATAKEFTALISDTMSHSAMVDSIVEEWAHFRCYPEMEHGIRFDLEYGHIRRAIRGIESGE